MQYKFFSSTLWIACLLIGNAIRADESRLVNIKSPAPMPMSAIVSMISDMTDMNIMATEQVAKVLVIANARNLPAMDVLNHIAAIYDFRIIKEEDGTVLIVTAHECQTMRNCDELIRVYSPVNVQSSALMEMVKDHLSETGTVSINEATNQVIVSDREDILDRLEYTITSVDQMLTTAVFETNEITSQEAGALLSSIVQSPGSIQTDTAGRFITVTDTPKNIERVRKALDELDKPVDLVTEIFPLRHASCDEVGYTIQELFRDTGISRDRTHGGAAFSPQPTGQGEAINALTPPGVRDNIAAQPGIDGGGTAERSGMRAFALGRRGSVVIDTRNNAIIVTAEEAWIERLRDIITAMDMEREPFSYTFSFAELETLDLEEKLALLLNTRGESYHIDKENNKVSLFTTPQRAAIALDLFQQWDKAPSQIIIEAKLLSVSDNTIKNLGLDFKAQHERVRPYTPSVITREGGIKLAPPIAAGSPITELSIGSFATSDYNLLIRAIATDSKTRIITEPRIATLNRKQATFSDARQEPYTVVTVDGQTNTVLEDVRFLDVGVTLEVLPEVNDYDDIKLDIMLKLSHLVEFRNNYPVVDTTLAQATSRTPHGRPVLLGGLQLRRSLKQHSGIPVLKDIPLLGGLFRNYEGDKTDRQLILIVTPYIEDDQRREEDALLMDITEMEASMMKNSIESNNKKLPL